MPGRRQAMRVVEAATGFSKEAADTGSKPGSRWWSEEPNGQRKRQAGSETAGRER
jgi:hypothetical protein